MMQTGSIDEFIDAGIAFAGAPDNIFEQICENVGRKKSMCFKGLPKQLFSDFWLFWGCFRGSLLRHFSGKVEFVWERATSEKALFLYRI